MHLELFLEEAILCISRNNGSQLGDMLRVRQAMPIVYHNVSQLQTELVRLNITREQSPLAFRDACFAHLRRSFDLVGNEAMLWKDLLAGHLRVLLAQHDIQECFAEQVAVVQIMQRIFANGIRWMLPCVYVLHDDLWAFAAQVADSDDEPAMEVTARLVNKTVTICLTDRSTATDSRKWGVYRMIGLLFRIYFRLGQLNLCSNVLRAMGATDLPAVVRYPAAHLVYFRFFLGRYFFINEDYAPAETELMLALEHCPLSSHHNKRLILHFLIPLRILKAGLLPATPLLQRYGLHGSAFYPRAIDALRRGHLQRYMTLLAQYQNGLLELGTFLVWEKLILIGYRNLLRRIYRLLGSHSRLSLQALDGPLRLLRLPMKLDEISCFAANLIDRGLIKGYLSQERAVLVLSQKEPFPPLSSARLIK